MVYRLGQSRQARLLARSSAARGREVKRAIGGQQRLGQFDPVFQRPFFDWRAGVDGQMHCVLGNIFLRIARGLFRHTQIKARRLQGKTARGQDLPPLFKNRQFPRSTLHPLAHQPVIPEMAAAGFEAQRPWGADKSGGEKAAIGPGEVESNVESLAAQNPKNVPMLPPWRAFGGERKGPRTVHAWRHRQQFRAHCGGQRVQLRPRVLPLDLPQRRHQMHRIPEEAKINHDDFGRGACPLQKVAHGWAGQHGALLIPSALCWR